MLQMITLLMIWARKNIISRRNVSTLSSKLKKRKWNEEYIENGFFLPKDELTNPTPSAQCMFYSVKYSNQRLAPSKLHSFKNKA